MSGRIFLNLLFLSAASACAAAGGKIFVAQSGSDASGDGSEAKPYATLARALKDCAGGGEIFVKSGVYEFSQTAGIEKSKSKISITGESGAGKCVEFIGAKRIGAENLKRVDDPQILGSLRKPSKGVLYCLDLKKFGLTDYGKMAKRGFGAQNKPMQMEAFYSAERGLRLAKFPNNGILRIGEVLKIGAVQSKEWRQKLGVSDAEKGGAIFKAAHEIPESWLKHDDIWLSGTFSVGWADDHQLVKKIDPKQKTVELQFPTSYGVLSSVPELATNKQDVSVRGYVVYNLLEEIDEPLEYYIDRKRGMFFVMLSKPPKKRQHIDFSTLESPILKISESKDVSVSGIKFSAGRSVGLAVVDSNNVKISNCEFSNFGGFGANAEGYEYKPRNDYVFENCRFADNGSGGLRITGGDRKKLLPSGNIVRACDFFWNCRVKRNYAPSISIGGVGTVVEHCRLRGAEHQLLSFRGNDISIRNNSFEDACANASDMGAIYTGRDPSNKGIVIENNFFSNIRAANPDSKVCAVYIDDGSGGMTISKNIFCRSGTPGSSDVFAAVFLHGGHDNIVSKNVFIECDASAAHSRWSDKRWKKVFFEEYLFRLKKVVDIESEPYKKYKSLENFFTTTRERFNVFEHNLLYKTPPPYWGDFKLSNTKAALKPSEAPKIGGEWTLSDVEKYFGNNPLVKSILDGKIGLPK